MMDTSTILASLPRFPRPLWPHGDRQVSSEAGTPSGDGRRLRYEPALDGMRGLAVLAVLAYHADMPWARGGFLGVDAFFVLSGYLITALMIAEWKRTGSIDLLAFWRRRARRLVPALLLLLAGVIAYAAFIAEPEELSGLRRDGVATVVYMANWRPVLAGDSYFAQFSTPSPLLHMWSLSIEEQWYVVWPLVLLVAFRARPRAIPAFVIGCIVLAAGSALLMAWLHDPHGDPSRVYYGTDTRAQALLAGAALAGALALRPPLALSRHARIALEALAVLCVAYLAWMWTSTGHDSLFLYRGGFLLLAAAVAVVIAGAVLVRDGYVARVLSVRPLRTLGLVSYGVYLWHWPLFLVLTPDRTGVDGYALFALRLAMTLAVAAASYHAVEMPVRRGRLPQWKGSWMLAPASAAALLAGLVLVTRGGSDSVLSATSSTPPPSADAAVGERPVRVLVVGDSVAFTMAQGLGRQGEAANLSVWNQGKIGCGVLRSDEVLVDGRWTKPSAACSDWPARWQSYIDVFQPDVAVVLAGAWDLYDRKAGGRLLPFGTPEANAFAVDEFEKAVDVLSSRGATVVLLTTPDFEQPQLGVASEAPRFDLDRIHRLNGLYEEVANRRGDSVRVVDLNGFVEASEDEARDDFFSDGVHFTTEGADFVATWLAPAIRSVAPLRTPPPVAPTAATRTTGEQPPRWSELLHHIPDTQEARSLVVMNDYARFRSIFAVGLPARQTDGSALLDYYRRLIFGQDGSRTGIVPSLLSGMGGDPPRLTETEAGLGFTIDQVDQDVRTGDDSVQVLRGRFDTAALMAHADEGHSAHGEYLYAAASGDALESTLSAAAGGAPSLGDLAEFGVLAEALEGSGTYTASLSSGVTAFTVAEQAKRVAGADATPDDLVRVRTELEAQPKLRPYRAFAMGSGFDEAGPYTVLVLLHDDADAAAANAPLLRDRMDEATSWVAGRPWAEIIEDAEIETDGRLLVATLRSSSQGLWFGLPAASDTLLLHD
jgi:peptidoglycan/LPS O-acetylase OafA/YrhL/lysophospholipase L1-like esterase